MTQRPLFLLAAVAGTLAIAACGSSGSQSPVAGASQGLKFAACMRAHGVTDFPDPSGGGGGIQIPIGSSVNPAAAAFQAAQQKCQKLMPGGGPPPEADARQKAMMLHLAQCMRAHGVSGFPDPISSPPASSAGFRLAFGRPGAILVIPDTIDTSAPGFKQAAKACQLPGF